MRFLLSALLLLVSTATPASTPPAELDRVTVTAGRQAQSVTESVHSITAIDADERELVGATHPNEIFARIPGSWISRGSGQEHLTAIRSPVLAGAGACGAFLFLEDSIPVRPAGFCNVNQLFEINTEQADSLEVLRGPGSVLYGSNALHGVINVVHSPLRLPLNNVAITAGQFDQFRLAIDHSDLNRYGSKRFKYLGETSGGFQADSGFTQHKLNLGWHGPVWRAHIAANSLDQDTAGFIFGEDAWRDSALRRSNPNPEAFRKAESLRGWAVIERWSRWGGELIYRPYVRYSDMQFLQHFLPGKPLEENGQTSAGLITSLTFETDRRRWQTGVDLEWASGWLRETQAEAISEGSAFLQETRPAGRHYDYAVTQWSASPWINVEYALSANSTATLGLRADWIRYEYDNRMATGNAREDGSECGFGGCLFNRPANRSDNFTFISPKLGVRHHLGERHHIYGNLLRGFRVPQATELYRLQRGQDVADLEPEYIDSIELGMRGALAALSYDLALFSMLKRNVIFRDAEGLNVSDGRTRHHGIEFDLGWQAAPDWHLALRGTFARHRYAFDYTPDQGEQFVNGRDVDTAPRMLGSAITRWTPSANTRIEVEYQRIGSYYLNAENTEQYPGHGLWHVRWGQRIGEYELRVRINNLLDVDYAERADYAFGEHRYFPGWPRRVSFDVAYDF